MTAGAGVDPCVRMRVITTGICPCRPPTKKSLRIYKLLLGKINYFHFVTTQNVEKPGYI